MMMKVTREKHFNYMLKLAPALGLAYVLQTWLYLQYVPEDQAIEVLKLIGILLALMIAGFIFYDRFHEITLHPNSIEISFPPMDYHEEFSFRDIEAVEVRTNFFSLSDVVIHLYDGTSVKLRHVDQAEIIRDRLLGKKSLAS
jgi:hypothetical protein